MFSNPERNVPHLIILTGIVLSLLGAYPSDARGASDENHITSRILRAVRAGSFRGKIGVYYEHQNFDRGSFFEDEEQKELEESNLIVPFFQVEYLSPGYRNFSLGAGLTGYTHISENSEQKNRIGEPDDIILHQLYLTYDISETTLRLGRQSFEDSLFLSDYYEALSIYSEELDSLILRFYLVEKVAESDINEFIEFENVNRDSERIDDFLYAAEVTWDMIDDAADSTFYYYHQGHLYDLFGLHLTLSHDIHSLHLGLNADFYATDEDSKNGMRNVHDKVDDTNIYHINPYLEFNGFILGAGYIETDRLAGAREGGLIDDHFNPFNEGNSVYAPDAKTWYGTFGYEREPYSIGVIFGTTDSAAEGQRLDEREFDITGSLVVGKRYRLEAEFSRVHSDSPEGDYTLLEMVLTYEF